MLFNIYDKNLTLILAMSNVISSVWEENYSDRGACQLVVTDIPEMSDALQVGYFIGCNTKNTLWQIMSKEKRDNEIWLNGFTANYTILNDRVYDGIHTSNIVDDDLRNAVVAKRPAPIVELGTDNALTGSVISQHSYCSLFELCMDLCNSVGYGFRFVFDRPNKMLKFEVYNGIDRPNAVFAEKFGNLSNVILQQSDINFKNFAYVGGEGQDKARIYTTCGDSTATGLNRHEVFVDARDIRREEGMTNEQYYELLQQRGIEKLNEYNQKVVIEFDVTSGGFGTDYKLGDTVTCLLPEDMLKLEAKIIGYIETAEKDVIETKIKVGSPIIHTIGGK